MGALNNIRQKYMAMPVQIKASFAFLICSFMQKGISVITTPIFTRLMNTAEYGQYNVFNSWYDIITIIITMNLSYGVYQQGLVKFDEDRNIFSSSLQGLTLLMITVWTIIYLLFQDFFNSLFTLTTVQMMAMMVMIWSTTVFHFWATEQRVQFKYRMLVLVTIVISIIKPAVSIFLIRRSADKVTARILGLALVEFIGYSSFFFIQMIRGKKFYSKVYWAYALRFNIPLIPHYLSQTVLSSSDRIMIRMIVSSSAAGIYSLAYSISKLMTLFNTALLNTMNPWIYKKLKANKAMEISNVAYAGLLIIALVNLLLIAFAPEATTIFAPKEYHEAIKIIPPVTMSVFFVFSYSLFATVEFYYEKTKFIMAASVAGAILNILLNYIFIGVFGYIAAGYTTLFCYVVYAIGHYYFMNKISKQYLGDQKIYDLKTLLIIASVFLGIGFLMLFTYDHIVLRYGVIALIIICMFINRDLIKNQMKLLFNARKNK